MIMAWVCWDPGRFTSWNRWHSDKQPIGRQQQSNGLWQTCRLYSRLLHRREPPWDKQEKQSIQQCLAEVPDPGALLCRTHLKERLDDSPLLVSTRKTCKVLGCWWDGDDVYLLRITFDPSPQVGPERPSSEPVFIAHTQIKRPGIFTGTPSAFLSSTTRYESAMELSARIYYQQGKKVPSMLHRKSPLGCLQDVWGCRRIHKSLLVH